MHAGGNDPDPEPEEPRRRRRESITISYEARELLAAHEVDPSFELGARNAVETCLGLEPGQKLILVCEPGLEEIGAALLRAAEQIDAQVTVFLVDRERVKSDAFVTRLSTRLAEAQASVLVASVGGLPPSFRRRVIGAGGAERRHGHMVGITGAMMQQAMRADYEEVDALGRRLVGRMKTRSVIRLETTSGTALTIRLDPEHRWHNASGLLREPGWTNLPGGEVFTTPASVDGVLVPDGGAWLPDGHEIARAGRLRLRFEGGELTAIEGRDPEERRALAEAVEAAPNGRRVGQIGFGTNTGVLASIGSLLQDLKMPGFHVTLGDPCGDLTGACWTSTVEVPLLVRRPDVLVDDVPIMVRGRYANELR